MLRGAYEVLETCSKFLGVEPGGTISILVGLVNLLSETTPDGRFTLGEVECSGACVNAPVMSVGDDYYEDLTPETTVKVLEAFKRGEKPKYGPQNGRKTCEGPMGKTSLFSDPVPPPTRPDL
jgi:NADH dehydrogenase (ubiquinone) flavoprotein 2